MLYDITKVDITRIELDDTSNIDVRYSLKIPFLNRLEGLSVTVIMMNPSQANLIISDPTIDKLINFFYDYEKNGEKIKDLTICNIFPMYASNTKMALSKIRELHEGNNLEKLLDLNESKIKLIIEDTDFLVLAWGKPEVKTIHNILYYKEANRILGLIDDENIEKYVFEMKNVKTLFTEHGDPRHPGRSAKLGELKKVTKNQLLGF
ncbi:DUF1643 domain-containing protein [Viridibacillus sp. NPDC093762]|uniref:DUF1643 domain-containing protein n=1 Tax=Viridibacillus sp. NPDC093762 TaxID=3390720 RepID=UPI003D06840F